VPGPGTPQRTRPRTTSTCTRYGSGSRLASPASADQLLPGRPLQRDEPQAVATSRSRRQKPSGSTSAASIGWTTPAGLRYRAHVLEVSTTWGPSPVEAVASNAPIRRGRPDRGRRRDNKLTAPRLARVFAGIRPGRSPEPPSGGHDLLRASVAADDNRRTKHRLCRAKTQTRRLGTGGAGGGVGGLRVSRGRPYGATGRLGSPRPDPRGVRYALVAGAAIALVKIGRGAGVDRQL
jgi:hypothetical protein